VSSSTVQKDRAVAFDRNEHLNMNSPPARLCMNNLRQTGQKSGHRPPACTRRHVWSRGAWLAGGAEIDDPSFSSKPRPRSRLEPIRRASVSRRAAAAEVSHHPPFLSFPLLKAARTQLHCTAHHVQLALQLQWSGRVDLRAGFGGKPAWRGGPFPTYSSIGVVAFTREAC
jgi:hypothetical protein